MKALMGASDTALTVSKTDYVSLMKLFNVDRSESEGKFDHAFKSLGGVIEGTARGEKHSRRVAEPARGGRATQMIHSLQGRIATPAKLEKRIGPWPILRLDLPLLVSVSE